VIDELRQREASGRRMGVIAGAASRLDGLGGRVLIVDDNERQAQRMPPSWRSSIARSSRADPEKAKISAGGPVDLVIVNAAAKGFDGLRFAASPALGRAHPHLPILAMVDPDDRARMVKALEIGVNDILPRPIDPQELSARVKTQIQRKRYTDYLRHNLDHSLELAVTDQLTGLHNRRYMTGQLDSLVKRAALGGEPVAALLIDIDHFKKINDTFGHDVGDEVLREFALRLASNVRAIDLPCRYGGEEFVVIMPDTQLADALRIAERIRNHVSGSPFRVAHGKELLTVTISIGVSATSGPNDTPEALLKRADEGVYEAKASGRNAVVGKAA
jgi:two-component system cell cycle response regulator